MYFETSDPVWRRAGGKGPQMDCSEQQHEQKKRKEREVCTISTWILANMPWMLSFSNSTLLVRSSVKKRRQ